MLWLSKQNQRHQASSCGPAVHKHFAIPATCVGLKPPVSKFQIGFMAFWNETVSILCLVLLQFWKHVLPLFGIHCILAKFPSEANAIKPLLVAQKHFALLVMVTLVPNPVAKFWIGFMDPWRATVSILCLPERP